jgi:hypothetical protein
LNFKSRYETDNVIQSSLKPTRGFVENLPFAGDDVATLRDRLKVILDDLESRTLIT